MNKMGFFCTKRESSRGNIFAALFAGVALIGIIGVAAMNFMRGPLATATNTTRIEAAKTQMQMAGQLAVSAAINDSSNTPYARVFVTANQFGTGGNFGGVTAADTACQTRATAANLPGTYMAWISDNTSSPSTRFTQLNSPYRLLNGVTIANNWSDLIDGTLAAGINFTQTGTTISGTWAWTGTISNGTRNVTFPNYCNNWTDNTSGFTGTIGFVGATDFNWTSNATGATCSNTSYRLYCFQQTATPDSADCDNDGYVEPLGFKTTTGAKPTGGGLIPDEVATTKQDPWGSEYGYCAWNHGSDTTRTCGTNGGNRLAGANAQTWTSVAIISAGPDKTFQTTCSAFVDTTPADGNPDTPLVAKTGGSDDVIVEYTYANAVSASGGLWQLKSATPSVVQLTNSARTADIRVANEAALGASSCQGASDLGRIRFDTVTANLQVCNFVVTYDWRAIGGTGGSSIDGLSDGIAQYTTLFNVFLGDQAGVLTTAGPNTGVGVNVLKANTTGVRNVGVGGGKLTTAGTDVSNNDVKYPALKDNTTGSRNVAVGVRALAANTTGNDNTAIGDNALANATTASNNTAVGYLALDKNTASNNTAVGSSALPLNTTGTGNTAMGVSALGNNTTGSRNTAFGHSALRLNIIGNDGTAIGSAALRDNLANNNTAVGYQALRVNTSGVDNVGIGYYALLGTTTGSYNVGIGFWAAAANTTGSNNVAVGEGSLIGNNGSDNTAIGSYAISAGTTVSSSVGIGANALSNISTGSGNVALGFNALYEIQAGTNNVAVGSGAIANTSGNLNAAVGSTTAFSNTTGSNNTISGYNALMQNTTGSGNVAIGNAALAGNVTGDNNVALGSNSGPSTSALSNTTAIGSYAEVTGSNKVRLGNTSIVKIEGQVAFTATSDRRLKKDIEPIDLGLDFVMGLKPVSYRMKDGNEKLDYGFIAQDIAALVGDDKTNMVFKDTDKNHTYKLRHTDLIAPVVRAIQQDQILADKLEEELKVQDKSIIEAQNQSNLLIKKGIGLFISALVFGFVLVLGMRRYIARQGGVA